MTNLPWKRPQFSSTTDVNTDLEQENNMSRSLPLSRRAALGLGASVAAVAALSPSLAWAQAAPDPVGSVDMDVLLAENALPEKVQGSEDAPVTIVEYASMTCGFCARFHTQTLPTIKEKYVDTGQVRFVSREFPLDPRAPSWPAVCRE
ncbi:MAG: thioredoxin domain-containing protein, partial [Pseudomonadota bacterium]